MLNRIIILFLIELVFCGSAIAQQIKIASIGNSVTAGYLLDHPTSESYPAQLQKLLGQKYQVENFGHSGATLLKKGHRPYHKTKEFANALAFKPDVAIIHLGLNDTDPRNWPNYKNDFQKDYQWLIDTLTQVNPSITIYLCKLSPIFSGHPRFKSGTRDWYWQIQDQISTIAAVNHIKMIDLYAILHKHPELFADDLHPDKKGAGLIAKKVYEQVTGDYGGFQLDPIFTEHMVLPRDQEIPIYGKGNAGDEVRVSLDHTLLETIVGDDGRWIVKFPAKKFGGPYSLTVKNRDQQIEFNNVLVGDIWLCSGQSNMAFPLKASATGKQTLQQLDTGRAIRLLKYNPLAETNQVAWDQTTLTAVNDLNYFSGTWQNLSIESAQDFSAVGYYFAEQLAEEEDIPIGIIQVAVGGSTMESWIDRKTLEGDNLLVDLVSKWRQSDFIQEWARGRATENLKNAINPKQRHPYDPAYNFEAGISKVIPFPIKGVIWYQGESNAHNPELFAYEFPMLIQSWRNAWNRDLPFYYVQLSSIDRPSWPSIRNLQRELSTTLPHVGMAVSSDLGDSLDVHPVRKKELGHRLALLALKNTYHKKIVAEGPKATHAFQKDQSITVEFSDSKKLAIDGSLELNGFELQDEKGNFYPVRAEIKKNTVYLKVPNRLKIKRVVYAWQPFTRANLINEAGLPASTFSITLE